jgi:hypothetical protein
MHSLSVPSVVTGGLLALFSIQGAQAACDATPWFDYRQTSVQTIPDTRAYFYVTSRMAIDADGAPNAYHPQDKGIDALANAGYPQGNWKSILVVDPGDPQKPFMQTSGAFAGFFLSQTTLQASTLFTTDPQRYVDSTRIPYVVFPGAFYATKGTGGMGDFVMVTNLDNGQESAAIVADVGPRNDPLGEVSIRLAENLGGHNVNPRTGAGMPTGRFAYVVFPRSKATPAWPLRSERLDEKSQQLLSAIGGWQRILPCVGNP